MTDIISWVEDALFIDSQIYDFLPENMRNPGVAGLCSLAIKMERDDVPAEYSEKTMQLCQEALGMLEEDEQAFVKPLVNKIYSQAGGFERELYDSSVVDSMKDKSYTGQLTFRPKDGRFFILAPKDCVQDARGLMESIGKETGSESRAAVGWPHITVNEGMSRSEGEKWFETLKGRHGETDSPLFEGRDLVYLNVEVPFTINGAYEGHNRTNAHISTTYHVSVTSPWLDERAEEGLKSTFDDYVSHITYGEKKREGITKLDADTLSSLGKSEFGQKLRDWLDSRSHAAAPRP